jgi:hypothetical protein
MAKMYGRFRLFSVVLALVQLLVLGLNVGGKMTKSGGLFVAVGFFMLLLNIGIVTAAGWASMPVPLKRGLILVSGMTAIAFLLWIVSDWTGGDAGAVAVVVLLLTAASWVGLLLISGRLVSTAAGSGGDGAAGQGAARAPGLDSCGKCILNMLRHSRGAQEK